MIKHVTDVDFNENIKEGTVLVDFYADWCGPCRMIAPILEEIDKEKEITIIKVNVDECPLISRKYGIMSIPTIILFKNGEEVQKQIGLCSKDVLEGMLD